MLSGTEGQGQHFFIFSISFTAYSDDNIRRDANFSICQVVMIAEGNRRMPKAFVGVGMGGGLPHSHCGGGVWGFSTRIF